MHRRLPVLRQSVRAHAEMGRVEEMRALGDRIVHEPFVLLTPAPVHLQARTESTISRRHPPGRDAHHVRRLLRQEPHPPLHELAAPVEQVTALVGGFGLVLDGVRERRLADFARDIRSFRRPYAEARPRADVSFQLTDTKSIISFGPKPFPTNLPTWTDWRSVGESELARGRERRRAQGRGKGPVGPWRSERTVLVNDRIAQTSFVWTYRTLLRTGWFHGPTERLLRQAKSGEGGSYVNG